jgi:hypothetical protein
MRKENKRKLEELMTVFSSMYTEQDRIKFQLLWQPYYKTLSDMEKPIAINSWFNTMLDNAKNLKEESINFAENGSSEDRQFIAEMLNGIKEHPFLVREQLSS